MKGTVTCEISTRGRVLTTLPMTVLSIAHQTEKPEHLWIYDDTDYGPNTEYKGERPDYRENWLWRHIFNILTIQNIQWKFNFGRGIGQVANHQEALLSASTDLIWRVDDDNFVEPNVLSVLKSKLLSDESIGAVGQTVLHADQPISAIPSFAKNKMTKGIFHQVAEWFIIPDGLDREAEHLYSTYLYRREAGLKAGGYPMDLSPVGHHEETIFSHKIFRAGYKLLVTPQCRIWHLRNPQGGIREYQNEWLWKHDQTKQDYYMASWGYNDKPTKFYVMSNGLGDMYAFKSVMKEIFDANQDSDNVIVCPYPDVFADTDAFVITPAEHNFWERDFGDKYNPYRIMANNPQMHLTEAFKKLYMEDLK